MAGTEGNAYLSRIFLVSKGVSSGFVTRSFCHESDKRRTQFFQIKTEFLVSNFLPHIAQVPKFYMRRSKVDIDLYAGYCFQAAVDLSEFLSHFLLKISKVLFWAGLKNSMRELALEVVKQVFCPSILQQ